ncbi:sulfur carrier protein ThiS [Ectobacillus panaciterrae]|uniref:sulfur carrier protein ThiS n=1 Tax=Ectobacillus panaciterrae TaxID=363872 RepID=UPI0004246070|nr:sulfur carrier protein ThiS [Ectobacillus panaciterrae]
MLLKINGKEVTVPENIATVEALLEHLGLASKIVVVEKNNVILEKISHFETTVFDGDQIEIVTFVGGG